MNFVEKYPDIVHIVTIMGILGIPSIFTMTVWCIKACLKFTQSLNFISSALKSEIRCDLVNDYEVYKERGWCSLIEQTEWLNRYTAYHNLYGDNGVLDTKKEEIEKMLNHPPVNN